MKMRFATAIAAGLVLATASSIAIANTNPSQMFGPAPQTTTAEDAQTTNHMGFANFAADYNGQYGIEAGQTWVVQANRRDVRSNVGFLVIDTTLSSADNIFDGVSYTASVSHPDVSGDAASGVNDSNSNTASDHLGTAAHAVNTNANNTASFMAAVNDLDLTIASTGNDPTVSSCGLNANTSNAANCMAAVNDLDLTIANDHAANSRIVEADGTANQEPQTVTSASFAAAGAAAGANTSDPTSRPINPFDHKEIGPMGEQIVGMTGFNSNTSA